MLPLFRLILHQLPKPSFVLEAATMSTSSFTLAQSNPPCTVNLPSNLTEQQLLKFTAFKNWISTLQHSLSLQASKQHAFHASPYKLRKIDIQAVDYFRSERIGFIKLQAEISNDEGEKLSGAVFLRGGSVGMLVSPPPTFEFRERV